MDAVRVATKAGNPAQGRARDGTQEHLPGRAAAARRRLAASCVGVVAVRLSAADRLDIAELLAREDNAATRRDAASYVALFSDDAILDGDKGEHRGRQALAQAVGPVWASERPGSVHLTLNAVITEDPRDPDHAVAGPKR